MRLRHCESGEAVELVEGEITYLGRGVLGVTDKRISRRQLQISLRGPALAVTVEGVNPVYVRRAGKAGEGELLSRGEEAILRAGDVVTMLADLHPLVLELDDEPKGAAATNTPPPCATEDVPATAATTTTEPRVVHTARATTSQKRKLPFDAGDEAETDAAQAAELMAAAQREIEAALIDQLTTPLKLNKLSDSDDAEVAEPARKKSRTTSSSSSSSSAGHGSGASRGAVSRGRGRGGMQRRGGGREVPTKRRAGSRHAARVAKERMGEYLELVAEAGGLDGDEDSEGAEDEIDPVVNPDGFDAAEWKKRADEDSDDEEHVSEGSDYDENGERPACRYGDQCYRRNADHLRRFAHP